MVETAFEISPYKADFPIFKNASFNSNALVYLDSGASAQKPQSVIDRIVRNYECEYANVHRGIYFLSENETIFYEQARTKIKKFINAATDEEIVFTKGATEAMNLFAHTFAKSHLGKGDAVVITAAEHHANIVPWHILQREIGFTLKVIPVTDAGDLDMQAYKDILNDNNVKIVSVTGMSNVLGTIMPVKEIAKAAHNVGAYVMIDGSQLIAHNLVDVGDIDCDFMVFSGHKLYAPTGIGVLYGKKSLLENMPVWQGGGDMVSSVKYQESSYQGSPVRFEAGTPPFVQAIGLGAAIDYLNNKGAKTAFDFEDNVFAALYDRVKAVKGVHILGNAENKGGLVSFVVKDCSNQDVGMILNQMGIAVRVGHHCAQPIVERMGYPSAIRASLGVYNGIEDVDALVKGIEKAKSMLL